nr:immunoglobulin light chain junction region [Macaca mulatta]
CQHYYSTPGSF